MRWMLTVKTHAKDRNIILSCSFYTMCDFINFIYIALPRRVAEAGSRDGNSSKLRQSDVKDNRLVLTGRLLNRPTVPFGVNLTGNLHRPFNQNCIGRKQLGSKLIFLGSC